jgi:hypothetical protein
MNRLLIAGAATLVMATRAMATGGGPTIYSFTTANYTIAQTFTSPCAAGPCANYTTAMKFTGSFTTATPLAANLFDSEIAAQITSYSFFDGINTYSTTNPNARIYEFVISTDAGGQITDAEAYLESFQSGSTPHSPGDRVAVLEIIGGTFVLPLNDALCTGVQTSPFSGVANTCVDFSSDSASSEANGRDGTWSVATVPTVQSVPTLGQWGTISLAALLLLFGWLWLRRREGNDGVEESIQIV